LENKDDEIAKEFADSLEGRFKPFEMITDNETAVTKPRDIPCHKLCAD